MGIRISGLDEVQRKLAALRRSAERLGGTNEVPLSELITSEFMRLHTEFSSLDEMFASGGFTVNSQADFEAIPAEAFDTLVRERTRFQNWNEILTRATHDYLRNTP